MVQQIDVVQNHARSLIDLGVEQIIMINENGRGEEMLSGNKTNLSNKKHEIFCMGFRLHHSLLQDFDEEYGKVNYFVVERDNAKLLSVPLYSHKLIAIMKKNVNHMRVIKKIQKIKDLEYGYLLRDTFCEAIASV
jgi:hypothetical protein